MTPTTYSTSQVMEITGATRRQLSYWCEQGRIPGQSRTGSGNPRRWTDAQVALIRDHLATTGMRKPLLIQRHHGLSGLVSGERRRFDLRARGRALTRLAHRYPRLFERLYEEELAIEMERRAAS